MHTSMNKAKFEVDKDKCTACGLCVKVCPGAVLRPEGGTPRIADFDAFGWNGCWKCQHCLAVCPAGAISILGKRPEDSLPPPVDAAKALDALIANRRSCRRYQRRNVDKAVSSTVCSRSWPTPPTAGTSSSWSSRCWMIWSARSAFAPPPAGACRSWPRRACIPRASMPRPTPT